MAHRNAQEAQNAPSVQGTRSTTRSTISKPHQALTSRSVMAFRSRTVSAGQSLTHGRARERAASDARRPFRTRSYGSLGVAYRIGPFATARLPNGDSAHANGSAAAGFSAI